METKMESPLLENYCNAFRNAGLKIGKILPKVNSYNFWLILMVFIDFIVFIRNGRWSQK